MEWMIEIGGRTRKVVVSRRGDDLAVVVDGRAFVVDARHVGRDAVSLLVTEGDGPARSVDASITARAAGGGFEVHVGGGTTTAELSSPFGRRGATGGAQGTGPQKVLAPMPGKVVRVLVAPGDEVQPRQGVVVVEAMKMENELRATRAGRVKDVRVAEGQSVEAGALLVTVE